MGDWIVTATTNLKNGYQLQISPLPKDKIGLRIGSTYSELTKDEARGIAKMLVAYADGFEFPPAAAVPDDTHEAFPERKGKTSTGPVA